MLGVGFLDLPPKYKSQLWGVFYKCSDEFEVKAVVDRADITDDGFVCGKVKKVFGRFLEVVEAKTLRSQKIRFSDVLVESAQCSGVDDEVSDRADESGLL